MFSNDKLQCLAEGFSVREHLKKTTFNPFPEMSPFQDFCSFGRCWIGCFHSVYAGMIFSGQHLILTLVSNVTLIELAYLTYFFLHVCCSNSLSIFFFTEIVNIPGKAPVTNNIWKQQKPAEDQTAPRYSLNNNKMSYKVVKERAACSQGHLLRWRWVMKTRQLSLIFWMRTNVVVFSK